MKKFLLFIICILLLSLISCGKNDVETFGDGSLAQASGSSSDKDSSSSVSNTNTGGSESSSLSSSDPAEKNIELLIKQLINGTDGSSLDSLTVMKAHNSQEEAYKVYAIITWNRKYTPADSRKIIQDYSNSIAGTADAQLGNIQELSLTWLASSLNGTASIRYDKADGMLALKEEAFDKKFGVTEDTGTDGAVQANGDTTAIVTESAMDAPQ